VDSIAEVEFLAPLKWWGVGREECGGCGLKCAGRYGMGNDPLVLQVDEGRVDPSPSGQHNPFGVYLFQGFVEQGGRAPG
jgi:hypothetical protein